MCVKRQAPDYKNISEKMRLDSEREVLIRNVNEPPYHLLLWDPRVSSQCE